MPPRRRAHSSRSTPRSAPRSTPLRQSRSVSPPTVDKPAVTINGGVATIQTLCNGEIHTVTITREGIITSPLHDREAEKVLIALGGEPSPCYRVILSYDATVLMTKSMVGLCDPPQMKWSTQRGWYSTVDCDECRTRRSRGVKTIGHYITPNHLAAAYNGYAHVILKLRNWVARTYQVEPNLLYRNHPEANQIMMSYSRRGRRSSPSPFFLPLGVLITPRYIRAAAKFVGRNADAILALRNNGITVDWLLELATLVSDRQARRNRLRHPHIHLALIAARNVPPRTVAHYMNAGVTSHYYTYARMQVNPADILAVEASTHLQKSLADLLNEGRSLPSILADA